MKVAVFLLYALALAAADELKLRLPKLASVFPQGDRPGTTLRAEVLGEYLDRTQSVIVLDSSITGRVVNNTYTRLELELKISPNASLGPHYFRIVSPRGASNLLLFRVGDQPHIIEAEPNTSFEQAQPVSPPVTINGRINVDGDYDFFRFRAEKGQTWVFDVRSARNGNGLDPALFLLDSKQRRIESSEDAFIWDPFFVHTFEESGDYYAVVQPTHAHNDPSFAYQLDIRTAPHLETIYPLSFRPGTTVEATVFGAALTGTPAKLWFDAEGFTGEVVEMRGSTARVRISAPSDAIEGKRQFAIVTPGGRSNTAALLVDATPVHTGGERIQPPVSINGIARYREPERFWFDVQPNTTLAFDVRAQRFGSPVDSVLTILDSSGKQLATNDDAKLPGDTFNKDSYLSHTFDKAGRYAVEMRNLVKTTGEDFPYQLVVRSLHPDFDLMLETDTPYGALEISAERKEGYEKPIPIEVEGLSKAEIAAGADKAKIPLEAGMPRQIRVKSGKKVAWRSVRIASGGGEGETSIKVDQATLAAAEKPLFSLEPAASNVNLVRDGSAEFEIMIQRAAGFRDPITFSFENLPAGVSADAITAGPDDARARIRLKVAKGAVPGRFSRVAVLGHASGGQVQEAPKIAVAID